jgi:16S rRNA (guanine(966)-N(2))-methyltransferase RsmD
LRIISGNHKGRPIHIPATMQLRPTTDAGKETLFNILGNYFVFEALSVLDLFSGTGNISYEFSSRGVLDVIAVDNNNSSVKFIKETAVKLKMDGLRALRGDAFKFIEECNCTFDIVFADPPYAHKDICLLPELVINNNLLKKNGWFILEHGPRLDLEDQAYYFEKRRIGNVNFSIFKP